MQVLGANLASSICAGRPMDDQRVGDATFVTLALPTLKRRIAGVGPSIGVMTVGLGGSKEVDIGKHCIERERNAVVPGDRVERAVLIAFG